jgi:hypothetical protein
LTDFGAWNTDHRREGEALVVVTDFGPAPLALRHWLIGVVEQTLRHAGYPGAMLSSRTGDGIRAPELDLHVRLRP